MAADQTERTPTFPTAVLLLAGGVSLFAVMDGLGKFLTSDFSVLQLVWARCAFAIPVIFAASAPTEWIGLLRSQRPALQIGRGLLPVLISAAVLLGLRFLPLADVTAITFAAPLFVIALSGLILGERPTMAAWIGVGLGFLGVLIVVRPGVSSIAWAALFPLAAALLFGAFQILTSLVSRNDQPATTLAWTMLTGFALTTPLLPLDWQHGSNVGWLLLVLTGFLFGVGHLMLIRAFAAAPAAVLTPFTYTQIVIAVIFGMLVFGEVPGYWPLVGTALIVVAGLYVLRSAR
jgi:drug/metabolite transporter (DMT)-like permease